VGKYRILSSDSCAVYQVEKVVKKAKKHLSSVVLDPAKVNIICSGQDELIDIKRLIWDIMSWIMIKYTLQLVIAE